MKPFLLLSSLSLALSTSFSVTAFAQDAAPSPSPPAPTVAPAPAIAPPPPAPPPHSAAAAAAAVAPPAPGCALGNHAGIDEADASTAASVVCSELANAGARADEAYRVDLARLGESMVLTVSLGTASRTVRLARIEEVTTAAPRVADALVHGKPMADTVKVDNLVGEETRQYGKRPGEFRLGVGVGGMQLIGAGLAVDPGIVAQAFYEAPRFAVGLDIRGGGSAMHADASVGYFMIGPVARYFTSDGDVTPYVGGGIAFSVLSYQPHGMSTVSGSGLDPFVEVGIEALRTHRARFTVGLRVDLPLYGLKGDPSYSFPSGALVPSSNEGYYAPVSLNAGVAW